MTIGKCPHCGGNEHSDGTCRRIDAIEYYPDGAIKRVEYYRISHESHHHHPAPNDGRMTRLEWERESRRRT